MNYFELFKGVCASLGEPIDMAVETLQVVPMPDLPIDRLMAEKPLSEFTGEEWEQTSISFAMDADNQDILMINSSVWQAFGNPPTLSLLLATLTDSLEAAGFFREIPGVAVPEIPTGVKTQVQPILPTSEALKSVTEDQFIFRMVSLLVGRLGFSQPDLEEALVKALQASN